MKDEELVQHLAGRIIERKLILKLYNDQRNAQVFKFIYLLTSALHVSGFLLAHPHRQVFKFGSGFKSPEYVSTRALTPYPGDCVNQIGKTQSKPSAARLGRGTALARYGNGMLCVNLPLRCLWLFRTSDRVSCCYQHDFSYDKRVYAVKY
jgi:hypothetical protein